ncbi:hypothetical protein BKA66DRAFT_614027 [Pyrenochaeta sp. MPI-SDFR-AT-0127]|nr:hypothetical protein BKA66DRAFT_614027 [Pyrenochaeta sp. MPI-SDFR-AT-0127]
MFNCCICGAITGVGSSDDWHEVDWLNRIRAVYINELDYFEPKLSGVGYAHTLTGPVTVPKETETSTVPQDIQPESLTLYYATPILRPDGTVHPHASNTGFIVHQICYQLLEWAFHPLQINIKTLNLFLRSFGIMPHGQVVNWGHSYAGLYVSPDANNRTIHMRNDPSHAFGTSLWEGNPLLIENEMIMRRLGGYMLKNLLEKGNEKTKTLPVHSRVQMDDTAMPSRLTALPVEILEYILMLLPSRDVLNARLASRIFLAIPLSKAFWRSRFTPGHELESVIEPWLYKAEIIEEIRFSDPKIVYEVLKSETSSRALANRRRLWGLLKPLVSALCSFAVYEGAFHSIEPRGSPLASLWQPELNNEDTARWDCAHGELLDSEFQPYHFGCRPLFKRHVKLPAPVLAVKVSALPFHNSTYITGLRFCLADNSKVEIGYVLSDREVSLSTKGTLRGFKVASGERGIHGLSLIDQSGTQTVAVGVVEGFNERRLGLGNPVTAVKAYFDGLKMVFIGVPDYIHNAIGPYSIWKNARDHVEISTLPSE